MWDTLLEVHYKIEVISGLKLLKLLIYNLEFYINYVVCLSNENII